MKSKLLPRRLSLHPQEAWLNFFFFHQEGFRKFFQFLFQNNWQLENYAVHAHLDSQIAANKPYIKYAMSGDVWHQVKEEFPDQLPRFVRSGVVFARMSSDQKQQLILELQAIGYYVCK